MTMAQQEFDELPGIIVHLLVDDTLPARALCSGEAIDPARWVDDTRTPRKQCQACFIRAAQRMQCGQPSWRS